MPEEKPRHKRHRERLDEPVHKQRDKKAARVLPHVSNCAEINLHHHGNDHQPDKDSNRHIDLAACSEFHASELTNERREKSAQQQSGDHTNPDPDSQVSFKEIETFGSGCHCFSSLFVAWMLIMLARIWRLSIR